MPGGAPRGVPDDKVGVVRSLAAHGAAHADDLPALLCGRTRLITTSARSHTTRIADAACAGCDIVISSARSRAPQLCDSPPHIPATSTSSLRARAPTPRGRPAQAAARAAAARAPATRLSEASTAASISATSAAGQSASRSRRCCSEKRTRGVSGAAPPGPSAPPGRAAASTSSRPLPRAGFQKPCLRTAATRAAHAAALRRGGAVASLALGALHGAPGRHRAPAAGGPTPPALRGEPRGARLKPMSHQARAVRAPTQGSRLNSRRERLPTAPARASPREVRICSFALRAAGGGERRSGASGPRMQA